MTEPDTTTTDLPVELRRLSIVRAVLESPFARVADLSERFGVSEVTIRSDLATLERQGKVRRVRGGAVALEKHIHETTFEESLAIEAGAKEAIGYSAAQMVRSGDTILLDVGTTADAVARHLVGRNELADVTVITNGLNIATILGRGVPRLHVIVTGGTLRPNQYALVEPVDSPLFARLKANIAFIGCSGVSIHQGITNVNLAEANVKRSMIAATRRAVVIADNTKIGRTSVVKVCDIDSVDGVLTDATADETELEAFHAHGIEVQIATTR